MKQYAKACLLLGLSLPVWAQANMAPALSTQTLAEHQTFDARQGVAVDEQHFYAVNSFRITKHRKSDGRALLQWDGESDQHGPLIHLDSGMVWQGKLYASHSNYPHWPMTSSVEVWDTASMAHIATYSFGTELGSFTWLDRHQGYWWGAFANYDKVQKGQTQAYGLTANTQVVKMNDQFQILEKWQLPAGILKRISPMSNSGGSWGPDGLLYLTGHDHGEIYVLALPDYGSELHWLATVAAPDIHGQGIAWERSKKERILWGIRKKDRKVFQMLVPEIAPIPVKAAQPIRTPGHFNQQ
ncbi:hypothetical protein [Bowmanella pacifica]|uniref:Cycloisomerase n=1 Tax=Bowmanella pacifica TaxID=502051 RepID=A0A917YZI8_9ALTE|nr:hypothetical protein [Bowmanella pacifica]GGO70619.1 hypothetical protein GCM10010982_24560 [Bowmanella pacifica]